MTTFSDAFRAEVLRVARKEIKAELGGLRQTVKAQRTEIGALKREVKALTSAVKALHKGTVRQSNSEKSDSLDAARPTNRRGRSFKFNPQALISKRKHLGISQHAMATLLEASSLSVYKWESGKVIPRAAQLERIRAVLKMGKREALTTLQG
jgi:DNA-binding transcriptional regulator YiaG